MNQKLLLLSLCVSANAYAAVHQIDVAVTRIETYESGAVTFYVDKPLLNPANCPASDKYIIGSDKNGKELMLSSLLSAKLSSNKIDVQVSDSVCTSSYPVATRIALR